MTCLESLVVGKHRSLEGFCVRVEIFLFVEICYVNEVVGLFHYQDFGVWTIVGRVEVLGVRMEIVLILDFSENVHKGQFQDSG